MLQISSSWRTVLLYWWWDPMGSSKTCASPKRILLSDGSCTYYIIPPWADINVREHLFNSLATAESIYPNCTLISIAGDFKRLDVTRLKRHFHLKQIVKAPTRKEAILDLLLTNLHDHYDKPQSFPPFGLSDHNTIPVSPLVRKPGTASDKFILKRDLQPSRKAEIGIFLCSLDWPLLLSFLETCDELLCVFEQVIHTGLDLSSNAS